jgi:hypothetical protein
MGAVHRGRRRPVRLVPPCLASSSSRFLASAALGAFGEGSGNAHDAVCSQRLGDRGPSICDRQSGWESGSRVGHKSEGLKHHRQHVEFMLTHNT